MSAQVTLTRNSKTLLIKTVRGAPTDRPIVDTSASSSTPDTLTGRRLARYNTSGGDIVANLPVASSLPNGRSITVKNEIGSNNVNVTPTGGNTVDGVAALHAVGPSIGVEFFTDGISNWTAI